MHQVSLRAGETDEDLILVTDAVRDGRFFRCSLVPGTRMAAGGAAEAVAAAEAAATVAASTAAAACPTTAPPGGAMVLATEG